MEDLSYSDFTKALKQFIHELDDQRDRRNLAMKSDPQRWHHAPISELFTSDGFSKEESLEMKEEGTIAAARGLKRKSSYLSDDDDSEQNAEGRYAAFLAEPVERKKRKRYPKKGE